MLCGKKEKAERSNRSLPESTGTTVLTTFAAHYNLSTVLLQKGEIDEAILHGSGSPDDPARMLLLCTHKTWPFAFVGQGRNCGWYQGIRKRHWRYRHDLFPALNNLAWISATYFGSGIFETTLKRSNLPGKQMSFSGGSNPVILRTLAGGPMPMQGNSVGLLN